MGLDSSELAAWIAHICFFRIGPICRYQCVERMVLKNRSTYIYLAYRRSL